MAVCEATANLWLKTYQAFEKYNIGVKLANPLKTKAIAEAKIKTDTTDARTLAHLLRSDLVAECYVASREIREDRLLLIAIFQVGFESSTYKVIDIVITIYV